MKKKKLILTLLLVLGLVSITVGVTYAFFNYTRTGIANNLGTGRIYFNTSQNGRLQLTNIFPVKSTDINTNTLDTVTVGIVGDTTYTDGEEFLISLVDVNNTVNNKQIPINYIATYEANSESIIGTSSSEYWTARNSKDANIYLLNGTGAVEENAQVLVGYIDNGATGINGTLTIKAYIDGDRIAISDTYDETESDNMGTTTEWVDGRTVFTTTEWNSFQTSSTPISFKIRAESNEGIWVEEELGSLEEIMKKKSIMDNIQSEFVSASTGINFGAVSSNTNGKGIYMRAGTENDTHPILYYRGAVEDNNVLFNNKCWKAVRTTDTGGVKLIYNGENNGSEDSPNCNNMDASINTSGTAFNTNYNSPTYVGYMWGTVYEYSTANWTSGAKFGSGFTWDGTNYKLTDATETTPNDTHHYSCNSTDAEATCTSIRYVYWVNASSKYYITISEGKGIEEAIKDMQTNTNPSNAKTQIDVWYLSNMNNVTNRLEDTIWCNDRSIERYNGWSATGTINGVGDHKNYSLLFGAHERSNFASGTSTVKNGPSLACANKNDAFTVNNVNGNQKLTYPVAMLTADEMVLAGGLAGWQSQFYLKNGSTLYWSLSPSFFYNGNASEVYVDDGYIGNTNVGSTRGIRPSVSLKPGLPVVSGDGTVNNPYVIG